MSIESVLAENRLIRKAWSRIEDGRQLLCLYTAMMDDPDARPDTCPASVCPQWLAYLLPWMDDAGTKEQWLLTVTRIARLAPRFGQLSSNVELKVRALCVKHTQSYVAADKELVHKVCKNVISLCEKAAAGETVATEEWEAASKAARAAWAAAEAASKAARAAWAAAEAASKAAWATWAEAEAADKLTAEILDLIEADLNAK
jgi:hypothetical protein